MLSILTGQAIRTHYTWWPGPKSLFEVCRIYQVLIHFTICHFNLTCREHVDSIFWRSVDFLNCLIARDNMYLFNDSRSLIVGRLSFLDRALMSSSLNHEICLMTVESRVLVLVFYCWRGPFRLRVYLGFLLCSRYLSVVVRQWRIIPMVFACRKWERLFSQLGWHLIF